MNASPIFSIGQGNHSVRIRATDPGKRCQRRIRGRDLSKELGRLSFLARLRLAPCRLGAWSASCWYTAQCEPSVDVAAGIYTGRAPDKRGGRHLALHPILDLTAEFNAPLDLPSRQVCSVPMLDPAMASLEKSEAAVRAMGAMSDKRPSLVHGAFGYARSALGTTRLLHCGVVAILGESIAQVQAVRRKIALSPGHITVPDACFHAKLS